MSEKREQIIQLKQLQEDLVERIQKLELQIVNLKQETQPNINIYPNNDLSNQARQYTGKSFRCYIDNALFKFNNCPVELTVRGLRDHMSKYYPASTFIDIRTSLEDDESIVNATEDQLRMFIRHFSASDTNKPITYIEAPTNTSPQAAFNSRKLKP